MVKKCKKGDAEPGKPVCLYTKDGSRLLGRHKDKQSAYKQEAAIKVHGSVTAVLDSVATLLDCRGEPTLATTVDTVAYEFEETRIEQLKRVGFSDELTRDLADANLADLVDDDLEDALKSAGFTNNVLTRDEDVAKKIAEERIDLIDESAYYNL